MPEFLELLPPTEARALLLQHILKSSALVDDILVREALGRVTAVPVIAGESLPAFARSTVDGFAVCARDTFGASDTLPAYLLLVGEIPMGRAPDFLIQTGNAG